MSNEVLDEQGRVIWTFREVPTDTTIKIVESEAIKLLKPQKSLRSEQRETEIETAIQTAIEKVKPRHEFEKAWHDYELYVLALYEWWDKEWARAVIDKFLEKSSAKDLTLVI